MDIWITDSWWDCGTQKKHQLVIWKKYPSGLDRFCKPSVGFVKILGIIHKSINLTPLTLSLAPGMLKSRRGLDARWRWTTSAPTRTATGRWPSASATRSCPRRWRTSRRTSAWRRWTPGLWTARCTRGKLSTTLQGSSMRQPGNIWSQVLEIILDSTVLWLLPQLTSLTRTTWKSSPFSEKPPLVAGTALQPGVTQNPFLKR